MEWLHSPACEKHEANGSTKRGENNKETMKNEGKNEKIHNTSEGNEIETNTERKDKPQPMRQKLTRATSQNRHFAPYTRAVWRGRAKRVDTQHHNNPLSKPCPCLHESTISNSAEIEE